MRFTRNNAIWEDARVRAGMPVQLATRRSLIGSGAAHLGWKVGLGAPAALEIMETAGPLVGFLNDSTLVDNHSEVSVSGWTNAIIEFEVAVYLGSDLGAGASEDEALASISAIGPAIELADIDLPVAPTEVSGILAGGIFHKAVILGAADETRAGLNITGLAAQILVDGDEATTVTHLEALTGPYPTVIATVANTLAAFGEVLRAGDVVITGSIVPPMPIIQGIEYTFRLHPLDEISVSIA